MRESEKTEGNVALRRPGVARVAMWGGTLCLLYLIVVAAVGLLASPQPSDLAVVLGNQITRDGRPSPRLQARLDTALALFRAGLVPRILVSGGTRPGGWYDEPAVMAKYLEDNGVPAAAISRDPFGTDTFETARSTAALMHNTGRVVAVTQWFHLPRTMLALRRFGLQDVSGDWPRFFELRDVYSFLREAVGLPYYAVRPFGSSPPS